MKKLLLLLLPIFLVAKMLQVGDNIKPIEIKSQHDKKHQLIQNGIWIITWDKTSTAIANNYFDTYNMPSNVNLIVDVSQIPSGILNLFVLPRMRHYSHEVLLSYDEVYNVTLPYKEECLTILHVNNKKIQKIEFIKTENELKKLFK